VVWWLVKWHKLSECQWSQITSAQEVDLSQLVGFTCATAQERLQITATRISMEIRHYYAVTYMDPTHVTMPYKKEGGEIFLHLKIFHGMLVCTKLQGANT